MASIFLIVQGISKISSQSIPPILAMMFRQQPFFEYDLVGVIHDKSSKGQCTNPLIRFDPIKGLAVGFFIAYRLLRRPLYRVVVGHLNHQGPGLR